MEEIQPGDKQEGMCMPTAAGKTWDCDSNHLVYPNKCTKIGEGSFAGEINAEKELEEDQRSTGHSTAVNKSCLLVPYPNSLLCSCAMDGMGQSHQKTHVLWLTSPFLPESKQGQAAF